MNKDTVLSLFTNIIDRQIDADWGRDGLVKKSLVKEYLLALKNNLIQKTNDFEKADNSKLTNAFQLLSGWLKFQINQKKKALKLLHPSSLMALELEGQISALELSMLKAKEILQEYRDE